MHVHGLAVILRKLPCGFDEMLPPPPPPSTFRFKDLLEFLLGFERLTVWFGLSDDSLFDFSCSAVSQLYSSREVAKSSAFSYSLKENNEVKNNFREFKS